MRRRKSMGAARKLEVPAADQTIRRTGQNTCFTMVICRACCYGGRRPMIKNLRLISHIVSRAELFRKGRLRREGKAPISPWITIARYAPLAGIGSPATTASWFVSSAAITSAARTTT